MITNHLIGAVDEFLQILTTNTSTLTAAGLNVTNIGSELNSKKSDLIAKNDTQSNLKTQLKNQTALTDAATTALYNTFSSRLDAVCGVVGKTTNFGKQVAQLRSDLRRRITRAGGVVTQLPEGASKAA